jgi:hypothetical protein
MNFTQRARGIVRAIAVVLSLALPTVLAISAADARSAAAAARARGASRPSRRRPARPPRRAAQPFNRTITQPGSPGMGGACPPAAASSTGPAWACSAASPPASSAPACSACCSAAGCSAVSADVVDLRPDPADRPDRHRGAAGDELVAAPQRRLRPMPVRPRRPRAAQSSFRTGTGFGLGSGSAPLEIGRPTTRRSSGCSARSRPRGRTRTSPSCIRWRRPEMVSYFTKDLEANKAATSSTRFRRQAAAGRPRGSLARRRNRLRQRGDALLAGRQDARSHHRPAGRRQRKPTEATEVWTFVRPRGANWELSAIQQT